MCGIAGIVTGHDKVNSAILLQEMLQVLVSRGPDEEGSIELGKIMFGTKRLALVNIDNGRQPKTSLCSKWAVGFNGEIYNYRDLANSAGIASGSNPSEVDVLLALFNKQGIEFVNLLNGVFAICLTDGKTVYLIRDRYGEKPLYYSLFDKQLRFASEAKALVFDHIPFMNIEENFFEFESNVGIETLFKGVFEVPAGCYLKFNIDSEKLEVVTYYSLLGREISAIDNNDAVREFRDLIFDAVKIRVPENNLFGCYVSGGIDSSSIALLSNSKYLFSAVVKDRQYLNESKYLDILENVSEGKVNRFTPDISSFEKYFVEMVYALDFPVGTLSAFILFLLAKRVKEENNIKIMLNGMGADEYMCGYARHLPLFAPEIIKNPTYKEYLPLFSKCQGAGNQNYEMYYRLLSRSSPTDHGSSLVKKIFSSQQTYSNSLAATDFSLTLPSLLRVDDRINMHFGIESRSPFLDHRIVDFVFTLPDKLKVQILNERGVTSKFILRKAVADILPKQIRKRKDKIGFPSPVTLWIEQHFSFAVKNALEIISSSPAGSFFLRRDIKSQDGEFDRKKWLILQFAAWYLLFFEKLTISETTKILFQHRNAIKS